MAELPSRSDGFLWRTVVRDAGDLTCDYAGPFDTLEEAELTLAHLVGSASPPYDEVWIERLPRGGWERVA